MRDSRNILVPIFILGILASMLVTPGLAAAQVPRATLVPTQVVTGPESGSAVNAQSVATPSPSFRGHPPPITANYDEQIGLTFTQNFTSLEYNVTAVEQTDPNLGTGPGYLLSALTNVGYWYQVGLSWDWSPGTGFAMSYEVFNSVGSSIFPRNGGGGLAGFSGPINPGDNVTLNLSFSSGEVVMVAEDTATGASAQVTYSSMGATEFVGQPNSDANSIGFFTGLMTEWYHGAPYDANPAQVIYSSNVPVSSGWFWMDEFNANNFQPVFSANASAVSTFSTAPTQLQEFSYGSITEYANALEFITGPAVNSTITSSTSSTSTSSSGTGSTTTATETVTATQIVTQTNTVTTTVTSTATLPVTTSTTTVTSPTTVTDTSTSTAPPSTTTTTQTATQDVAGASTVPSWAYALMAVLLLVGLGIGYLIRKSPAQPS